MDPNKIDIAFMECVFAAMCRLIIAIFVALLFLMYYMS
jgi:hypothetical protein